MIISHTGLNTQTGRNAEMAKRMMARLISREQAKLFADAGGVIGVWTHLADSALEFVQNIRAIADVAGIDHVCVGTDTKMAPSQISDSRRPQKNTNQSWDSKEGFFYTVVEAMLKTGFDKNEIMKIGGGNYMRIFDKATAP